MPGLLLISAAHHGLATVADGTRPVVEPLAADTKISI
jgi:hypothetical protein